MRTRCSVGHQGLLESQGRVQQRAAEDEKLVRWRCLGSALDKARELHQAAIHIDFQRLKQALPTDEDAYRLVFVQLNKSTPFSTDCIEFAADSMGCDPCDGCARLLAVLVLYWEVFS